MDKAANGGQRKGDAKSKNAKFNHTTREIEMVLNDGGKNETRTRLRADEDSLLTLWRD